VAVGTQQILGTTAGAGPDYTPQRPPSADVFYRFRLDEVAALSVALELDGPWRARLHLAAGACDGLTPRGEARASGASPGRLAFASLGPGEHVLVVAGDGSADSGPFVLRLVFDAAAACGDGRCVEGVEDPVSCPEDCPLAVAGGNGVCQEGETPAGCPEDCPACGDGICEPESGEDAAGCPVDCPPPANDRCADASHLDLNAGPVEIAGTTLGARADGAHRCGPRAHPAPDVFYSFELAEPAAVRARLSSGGAWAGALFLTSGGCEEEAPVEACSTGGDPGGDPELAVSLRAGSYLLSVAGFSAGESGEFSLDVAIGDYEPRCGDGDCEPGEDPVACPGDCADRCGNGLCEPAAAEDWLTCPRDCEGACGDRVCDSAGAEDEETCPSDCAGLAPPENDLCADAAALGIADGLARATGSTAAATHDLELHGAASPDVYHRLRLESPASVTVELVADPPWDTTLYLLADGCEAPRSLAVDDDAGAPSRSLISLGFLAVGDYLLAVTGYREPDAGAYELSVALGPPARCGDDRCDEAWEDTVGCPGDCPPPAGPDNDRCEDAHPLGPGEPVLGTTRGAVHDASGHFRASPDVFYHLNLPEAASARLDLTSDPPWDTYLYLLSGSCDAAVRLARNDDGDAPGSSTLDLDRLEAGDYLVVVTGYDAGASGDFALRVTLGEPASCGDGVCQAGAESPASCPRDCPTCGDGACGPGETPEECPEDCAPAPDNDSCEQATLLDVEADPTVEGTTAGALADNGEQWVRTPDVFYRFRLEEEASVLIRVEAQEGWTPVVELLAGTCAEPAGRVAVTDSLQAVDGVVELAVSRVAAGDYRIVVATDGFLDHPGSFSLQVLFAEPARCGDGVCSAPFEDWMGCEDDCDAPVGPLNDRCEDALLLPHGDDVSLDGTLELAQQDSEGWCSGADVFYRFVLEEPASLALRMPGADGSETCLALLGGPCDALEELDYTGPWLEEPALFLPALDPGEYFVLPTNQWFDGGGPFTLWAGFGPAVICGDGVCSEEHESWRGCPEDCVEPPAPEHDVCATERPVSPEGEQRIEDDTTAAGPDFDGHASAAGDLFYGFTLDEAASLDLWMVGAPPWDTYLYLLSGPCDAPVVVDSNDDAAGGSRLFVPLLEPGRYHVVATGYAEDNFGPFVLDLVFSDPIRCGDEVGSDPHEDWGSCPDDCDAPERPANDTCEAAELIASVGESVLVGTTLGAAHDLSLHFAESRDVFYTFTLEADAEVHVSLVGDGGWDTYLYLATGDCDTLAEFASNDDDPDVGRSGRELAPLAAGTYWLVVTGYGEDHAGPFDVTLSFPEPS